MRWITLKLAEFGLRDVRLRSDLEPSARALAEAVRRRRSEKTILEAAPEASHQAIGGVERFHRTVQDQVRALKLEAEEKIHVEIAPDSKAATWIIRHASWLLMRYAENRDLRSTMHFRIKGTN